MRTSGFCLKYRELRSCHSLLTTNTWTNWKINSSSQICQIRSQGRLMPPELERHINNNLMEQKPLQEQVCDRKIWTILDKLLKAHWTNLEDKTLGGSVGGTHRFLYIFLQELYQALTVTVKEKSHVSSNERRKGTILKYREKEIQRNECHW